jgi:hypothetical protein
MRDALFRDIAKQIISGHDNNANQMKIKHLIDLICDLTLKFR